MATINEDLTNVPAGRRVAYVPVFGDRCAEVTRVYCQSPTLLDTLVHGRRDGHYWRAGDVNGDRGKSFSINLNTGVSKDFADGEKGCADLVALHHRIFKTPSMLASLLEMERAAGIDYSTYRPSPRPAVRRKVRVEPPKSEWNALAEKPGKRQEKTKAYGPGARIVKEWAYTGAEGEPLFFSQRWEAQGKTKTFLQTPAKGHEGEPRHVPLYLPEVLAAIAAGQRVYLVEGEGKCDKLRELGACATTFIGGAANKTALREGAKYLQGANLYAIQDCDQAGDGWLGAVAEGCEAAKVSLKAITLPAPRFRGYDVADWVADGGILEELLALGDSAATLVDLSPPEAEAEGEEAGASRPLDLDPLSFGAGKDFREDYLEYDWLLEGSLQRGDMGAIVACGGCGKGAFALELALCVAGGKEVFGQWAVAKKGAVLYLAAEDAEVQLHNRARAIIRKLGLSEEAADYVSRIPVRGQITLFRETRPQIDGPDAPPVIPTQAFDDLRALIEKRRAVMVILDTAACFMGVEENDNVKISACFTHLNGLCQDYGCNILLVHHTGKPAGNATEYIADDKGLEAAMSQYMARGASAFAASCRWILGMAPLAKKFAAKLFNLDANEVEAGQYVAARVVKKNVGRAEGGFFLQKGLYGILSPVETAEEQATLENAARLVRRLNWNIKQGLGPVPANSTVMAGVIDDEKAYAAAVKFALGQGWIVKRLNGTYGTECWFPTEVGEQMGEE